jgi:hypothetical protein
MARLLILIGLLWAGMSAMTVLDVYETARWPTASGTILTSFMRDTIVYRSSRAGARRSVESFLAVTYAYTVDGRQYIGSRLSVLPPRSSRAKLADYPPGRAVVVHYDPNNRAEAVIDTSMPWTSVMHVALGSLLVVGTLFGMRARAAPAVSDHP